MVDNTKGSGAEHISPDKVTSGGVSSPDPAAALDRVKQIKTDWEQAKTQNVTLS